MNVSLGRRAWTNRQTASEAIITASWRSVWLTVAAGMKHAQSETAECECPQLVALAVQSLQVADGAQVQWLQAIVPQVQLGHLAYSLQSFTFHPVQPIQSAFNREYKGWNIPGYSYCSRGVVDEALRWHQRKIQWGNADMSYLLKLDK